MAKNAKIKATKHSGLTDGSNLSFELVISYDGQEGRIRLSLPHLPAGSTKVDREAQMDIAFREFSEALSRAEGLPLKI